MMKEIVRLETLNRDLQHEIEQVRNRISCRLNEIRADFQASLFSLFEKRIIRSMSSHFDSMLILTLKSIDFVYPQATMLMFLSQTKSLIQTNY